MSERRLGGVPRFRLVGAVWRVAGGLPQPWAALPSQREAGGSRPHAAWTACSATAYHCWRGLDAGNSSGRLRPSQNIAKHAGGRGRTEGLGPTGLRRAFASMPAHYTCQTTGVHLNQALWACMSCHPESGPGVGGLGCTVRACLGRASRACIPSRNLARALTGRSQHDMISASRVPCS